MKIIRYFYRRKMKKGKGKLTSVLIPSFALVAVFLLGLLGFLHIDNLEAQNQHAFAQRISYASEFVLTLDAMDQTLSSYFRNRQEEHWEKFKELSLYLQEHLVHLQELFYHQSQSASYIRRAKSFNTYLIYSLFETPISPIQEHRLLVFFRAALPMQRAHAMEFLNHDIVFAQEIYAARQSVYTRQKTLLWIGLLLISLPLFLLSMQNYKQVSKSMKQLQKSLNELRLQNWDTPDLSLLDFHEFQQVSKTVNDMKHKIREHIQLIEKNASLQHQLDATMLENEKKEKKLIEAQFAMIKSQINPHFLFNSLNLIGKTAVLNEPEQAMELVESMAHILRYSLSTKELQTTIGEEIEIVQAYLHLQKTRFGKAISCHIYVEEALILERVPSMLIQPIVENCFKHAFCGTKKLEISLTVESVADKIQIIVFDNGKGFPLEKLDEGREEEVGIGIRNLNSRIELEYGIKNALQIESKVAAYTKISMLLPKHGGGE